MNRNWVKVVVCIALVGIVAGCGGRKIGKLSESDFIELNAQMMALVSKGADDPEAMGTKMDELLKKYDMTQEDMNKLSEELHGDAERMKDLGPKIMQRAKELGAKY